MSARGAILVGGSPRSSGRPGAAKIKNPVEISQKPVQLTIIVIMVPLRLWNFQHNLQIQHYQPEIGSCWHSPRSRRLAPGAVRRPTPPVPPRKSAPGSWRHYAVYHALPIPFSISLGLKIINMVEKRCGNKIEIAGRKFICYLDAGHCGDHYSGAAGWFNARGEDDKSGNG